MAARYYGDWQTSCLGVCCYAPGLCLYAEASHRPHTDGLCLRLVHQQTLTCRLCAVRLPCQLSALSCCESADRIDAHSQSAAERIHVLHGQSGRTVRADQHPAQADAGLPLLTLSDCSPCRSGLSACVRYLTDHCQWLGCG